jgi:hypothetical protein
MQVLVLASQGSAGSAAGGGLLFLILLLLFLYFIPAFVAGARGHQNATAIFVLNLFLGWSVLGWVIALVWAFTAVERPSA